MLIHTSSSSGRSSIVEPSAAEPWATTNRWSPSGSSRKRMPSAHGSGSTTRIRTCHHRAKVGTRPPCTTTDTRTTTKITA